MIDLSATVALLHRQHESIADLWTARYEANSGPHTLLRSNARAVVAALTYSFEAAEQGAEEGIANGVLTSLLTFEPNLTISIEQTSALRLILHRTLVINLPPEQAIASLERLHQLIDQLLDRLTDSQFRRLEDAAFVDVLTDAGNRRALERDAARELANAERHGRPLCFVALDLDGLKRINDDQGHAAGDQALRGLVETLRAHLRAGDVVYRIGGDEFVVMLPETEPERVDVTLARALPMAPSFSYGISCFPRDGAFLDTLLDVADQRLLNGRRERRQPARSGGQLP